MIYHFEERKKKRSVNLRGIKENGWVTMLLNVGHVKTVSDKDELIMIIKQNQLIYQNVKLLIVI